MSGKKISYNPSRYIDDRRIRKCKEKPPHTQVMHARTVVHVARALKDSRIRENHSHIYPKVHLFSTFFHSDYFKMPR